MAVAQHKDHADLAPARSESRYGSNQRSNAIALAHPIGGVDPDHASHTRIDFSVEFPPAIGIRAAISHLNDKYLRIEENLRTHNLSLSGDSSIGECPSLEIPRATADFRLITIASEIEKRANQTLLAQQFELDCD
jgi:hypothetical protein